MSVLLNSEWIQKLSKDNSYPSRLGGNLLFLKNSPTGENKMQKRYVILKGNLLFYFYKKSDKIPLGLIVLEGYTVELSNEFEGYCFQLLKRISSNNHPETENLPSYTFVVDNPELLDTWIGALTTCSYENVKLTVESLKEQASNLFPNEFNEEQNSVEISVPSVAETKRKSKTFAELHEQYGKQIEDMTKIYANLPT